MPGGPIFLFDQPFQGIHHKIETLILFCFISQSDEVFA